MSCRYWRLKPDWIAILLSKAEQADWQVRCWQDPGLSLLSACYMCLLAHKTSYHGPPISFAAPYGRPPPSIDRFIALYSAFDFPPFQECPLTHQSEMGLHCRCTKQIWTKAVKWGALHCNSLWQSLCGDAHSSRLAKRLSTAKDCINDYTFWSADVSRHPANLEWRV